MRYNPHVSSLLLVAFLSTSDGFCPSAPSKQVTSTNIVRFARRGRKSQSKQAVATKSKASRASRSDLVAPKIQLSPLQISRDCTIQVAQIAPEDPWWELAENPYGARVWPSALGIAEYLWQPQQQQHLSNNNIRVFELGCGTGLVSQTAALAGAQVVQASDISPLALQLTRKGWEATTISRSKHQQSSLATTIYDVTKPLPSSLPTSTLLVASAVLYEGDLGEAIAKRVLEAYKRGMWILLGDDDTGYREGGRQRFLEQLGEDMLPMLEWNQGTVRCPQLGWRGKTFAYLELNPPSQGTA